MHSGRPLLLLLLAAAGLWYFQKQRAAAAPGGEADTTVIGPDGQPVSIGHVGASITQNDTRGEAIAKGIAALLGDPYSQGTVAYEDSDMALTVTRGMDVSGQIFGPRIEQSFSGNAFGEEPRLVRFYTYLSQLPDPAARREAWLFSWSQPFSSWDMSNLNYDRFR